MYFENLKECGYCPKAGVSGALERLHVLALSPVLGSTVQLPKATEQLSQDHFRLKTISQNPEEYHDTYESMPKNTPRDSKAGVVFYCKNMTYCINYLY